MIYGCPDYNTLKQWQAVLDRPDVLKAALMPDAHVGYTMPIGGVALTEGTVYPSWVGYDIGCGVCAVRLGGTIDYGTDKDIHAAIMKAVPRDKHNNSRAALPDNSKLSYSAGYQIEKRGAFKQLGTLGSGNHFIEIAQDEMGELWIVIHSGSRGVGHGIAGHWMDYAKSLSGRTDGMDPLNVKSVDGKSYINDMNWCLEYALSNRLVMLELIEDELDIDLDWDSLINKVHNAAYVTDAGVLHRKGATGASLGEYGVIPGNMRDGSVIVTGLGNPNSLESCSHGAGRAYSRGEAKRKLSLETFQDDMVGVTASVNERSIDECPAAYKDFDEVMEWQKDLCIVVHRLRPLINVKG